MIAEDEATEEIYSGSKLNLPHACDYVCKSTQNPCKNKWKIQVNDNEHCLCWKHWKIWYKEQHPSEKSVREPWELLKFSLRPPIKQMTEKNRKALRTHLRCEPSEKDGHIYVYRMQNEQNEPMFKIGYTTQAVHQRLEQWPGSVLVHSWRTSYVVYAETLIHLYLQHWRVYRFVLQGPPKTKQYISVWYDNPLEPVEDVWWVNRKKYDWIPENIHGMFKQELNVRKKCAKRYRVEKEWFYCDYEYIKEIIRGLLKDLERCAKDNKWYLYFQ